MVGGHSDETGIKKAYRRGSNPLAVREGGATMNGGE